MLIMIYLWFLLLTFISFDARPMELKRVPSNFDLTTLPKEILIQIFSEIILGAKNMTEIYSSIVALNLTCKLFKQCMNDDKINLFLYNAIKRSAEKICKEIKLLLLETKSFSNQDLQSINDFDIWPLIRDTKYNNAILCLKDIVKNNLFINIKSNITGYSSLHYAVRNGSRQLVNSLLLNFAKPNAQDKMNKTPIMIAAQKNNLTLVQDLIFFDADMLIEDEYAKNAIHYSIVNGSVDCLVYMINYLKNTNPEAANLKNSYGQTLLHIAILYSRAKNENTLKLLLYLGADTNLKTKEGIDAYQMACNMENHNIAKIISKYKKLKLKKAKSVNDIESYKKKLLKKNSKKCELQ